MFYSHLLQKQYFQSCKLQTIPGAGKFLNASVDVSVIRRLVVRPSFVFLALTIHLLAVGLKLALTSATDVDWLTKCHVIRYHVCVIMHVKDPLLFVLRVGHRALLADFCLSVCI